MKEKRKREGEYEPEKGLESFLCNYFLTQISRLRRLFSSIKRKQREREREGAETARRRRREKRLEKKET